MVEWDDLNCNTIAPDFVENFRIIGGSIDVAGLEEGYQELGV